MWQGKIPLQSPFQHSFLCKSNLLPLKHPPHTHTHLTFCQTIWQILWEKAWQLPKLLHTATLSLSHNLPSASSSNPTGTDLLSVSRPDLSPVQSAHSFSWTVLQPISVFLIWTIVPDSWWPGDVLVYILHISTPTCQITVMICSFYIKRSRI